MARIWVDGDWEDREQELIETLKLLIKKHGISAVLTCITFIGKEQNGNHWHNRFWCRMQRVIDFTDEVH